MQNVIMDDLTLTPKGRAIRILKVCYMCSLSHFRNSKYSAIKVVTYHKMHVTKEL